MPHILYKINAGQKEISQNRRKVEMKDLLQICKLQFKGLFTANESKKDQRTSPKKPKNKRFWSMWTGPKEAHVVFSSYACHCFPVWRMYDLPAGELRILRSVQIEVVLTIAPVTAIVCISDNFMMFSVTWSTNLKCRNITNYCIFGGDQKVVKCFYNRVFLYLDISCQIVAESCQHWHLTGGNHWMSMLVGFCHDLAGNAEIRKKLEWWPIRNSSFIN